MAHWNNRGGGKSVLRLRHPSIEEYEEEKLRIGLK